MFERQRINNDNLSAYLHEQNYYQKILGNIQPLLQCDYGEANDCTLTSITTVIHSYLPSVSINTIYNQVETIAKRYGYTGIKGTQPIIIRTIYQESLNAFKIPWHARSKYLKGIGFTWNFIKENFEHGNAPIILNLWKDGRNYYYNHTVLIIGYLESGNKKMLAVYDNWFEDISYIDYGKLSTICSIQYILSQA